MAIQFATGKQIGVAEIRTYIGGDCDQETTMGDVRSALAHWHVPYRVITGTVDVQAAVDQRGHIVIAPALMSDLSRGVDFQTPHSSSEDVYDLYADPGYHFLIIKGISYDGQWVVAYDPDVFDGNPVYFYDGGLPKGKDRYYRISEFATALADNGNHALEILQSPTDGNVEGVVRDSSTGAPVSDTVVSFSDGKSRPSTVRTDSDGRYSFARSVARPAVLAAIRGDRIGSVQVTPGLGQEILLGPSNPQQIVAPTSARIRATFVSTGAPDEPMSCSGTFGLLQPSRQVIFPDYLTYAGVQYKTGDIVPANTELVFYLQPGGVCAGSAFLSTDPARAVITQPGPNTWLIGWKDWGDADFNDLIVRIDLEPAQPPTLQSPIATDQARETGTRATGAGAEDPLPAVDAYMDHKYPTDMEAQPDTYTQTVTFRGDDSAEVNPLSGTTANYSGNDGTDFRLDRGTPVMAVLPGTVTYAGQSPLYCPLNGKVYGAQVVEVQHDNGYLTQYGWLDSIPPDLTVGAPIARDPSTPLGYSGVNACTGRPGLHFVIRNSSGLPVDPFGWNPRPDSFWYGVDDPWQTYSAAFGREATSQPLWSVLTNAVRLVDGSSEAVLASPSGLVTATLPAAASAVPLRVELIEAGPTGQMVGQQSISMFTLFGYAVGDEPLTSLDRDMWLDVALEGWATPAGAGPGLYLWDTYSSSAPHWRQLSSAWDPNTSHLTASVARLGTFLVTRPLPTVFLPIVIGPH